MMENENPIAKEIFIYILIASFTVFPYFSVRFMKFYTEPENLIITCVFLFCWFWIPIAAVKLKSKKLFKLHNIYWIVVTVSCCILLFETFVMSIFPIISTFLFFIFISPLAGIDYLFNLHENPAASIILVLLPLCMFLYGFLMKRKFLKEEL